MKSIHFICKDNDVVICIDKLNQIYTSGDWPIDECEASILNGGMIYLHNKKSHLSHFGGIVQDFTIKICDEYAREKRVVFTVKSVKEGKGVKWVGKCHDRAWTSGVIDEDGIDSPITDEPTI